ncbi:hypothetical protein C8J56DRAFT_590421 [Mycena floridula]|nr:hypothetical protein C8J56DRAFT_590421 [Mycena floridula]
MSFPLTPVVSFSVNSGKRKRTESDPVAGPSRFDAAVVQVGSWSVGTSRKPLVYQNSVALLQGLKTCFQSSKAVDFTGSYSVGEILALGFPPFYFIPPPVNSPAFTDKHRVQLLAHDIWKETGYRFTVKDHPPVTGGHKTRLWCSQDEARKQKQGDGVLPRHSSARARFPCQSRLVISSRDSPARPGERLVVVRAYHLVRHEPYDLNYKVPPPHAEKYESEEEEEEREEEEESAQTSPSTSVSQEDEMTPDLFQKRMRTHIRNIREFCDGLEYQMQFNEFRLLEEFEREGQSFLSLVHDCLKREGRLEAPDIEIIESYNPGSTAERPASPPIESPATAHFDPSASPHIIVSPISPHIAPTSPQVEPPALLQTERAAQIEPLGTSSQIKPVLSPPTSNQ